MTTLTEFNQILTKFAITLCPEAIRGKDVTSHKLHIYDQLFGKGAFGSEKELTSPEAIRFVDEPPGTPGVKAENLMESAFDEQLKVMEEVIKDPSLKLSLREFVDLWTKGFAERQAKCQTILVEDFNTEMEAIALDLESANILYNFITPEGKSKFLKRIKDKLASIKLAKAVEGYKTVVEIKDKLDKRVGSAFSIITWAGIFSGVRKKFGKIPVLLGPCPLKHADYVEIARSGKLLKFRATGSIFLASQEGGADAIKIEGILYKAEFFIMFLLWGLFIYGQSKFREMENIPSFLEAQNVYQIRKLNDIIITNTSLEKPSYEFHQTFPFVNKHFIIPNCYIETISIEDTLPLKDVLKYTILLRTYDKPKEVNWIGDKTGKTLYGLGNKTRSAKVCEYSLNAGWRMLNASGWLIDEQEWKIGSATKEGVLDTYYDIDWSSLGTMAYLSLMGAAT